MKIDAEIAILPHAFACLYALLVELIHFLTGIEGGIRGRVGRAHAESPITGCDGSCCEILYAHVWFGPRYYAPGVVAFAVIANHAAQDFMNRQLQHLAFDIPQRQIERAERMLFFTPSRLNET